MRRAECAPVRDLLALRPDDWADSERQRVEGHLAVCTECAGLARSYAMQDRVLRSLPFASLSAPQRREFLARLPREGRSRSGRPSLGWAIGAIVGVVALIAIFLAASAAFRQGQPDHTSTAVIPPTISTPAAMPSPTITPTTSLTPLPTGTADPSTALLGPPVCTPARPVVQYACRTGQPLAGKSAAP